jgi:hypothetical protein
VSKAKFAISDVVLRAVTDFFDVGEASVVSQERLLDRHRRNARTLTVHNADLQPPDLTGGPRITQHAQSVIRDRECVSGL